MRVKAVMTVTVWIDDAKSEDEISNQLEWCGSHLASEGFFVGHDPSATVDTWKCKVETEEVKP